MKPIFPIVFMMLLCIMISAGGCKVSMAQGIHTSSRNVALGGGGGAYMTGYHANFINPANLMLPERGTRVGVGVLGGLSTSLGGSLLDISLYNNNFTRGNIIDTPEAMRISSEWFGSDPAATNQLGFNLNVVPIGISYRRDDMAFSTAFRLRTIGSFKMSKGMFELGLAGLNSDVFGETQKVAFQTEVFALGEWSFGYAMQVWESHSEFVPGAMRVYAGIAPKILFGFGYASLGFDSNLTVSSDGNEFIEHEFTYFIRTVGDVSEDMERYYQERRVRGNTEAGFSDFVDDDSFSDMGGVMGRGFGLDLGGTWEWYMKDVALPVIGRGPQIVRASFSLTDIGSVRFNKSPGEFRAEDVLRWDGLNIDWDRIDEEYEDLGDYVDYVLSDSIGSDLYGNFSSVEVGSHKVGMNPMMHFGGSITMARLSVMMDIGKGFNSRGVNSNRFYTAIGTEYRALRVLPLRFGMRAGGYSGVNVSAGSGLDLKNFEFTFGLMTTPSTSGGMNVSFAWSGLVFRF